MIHGRVTITNTESALEEIELAASQIADVRAVTEVKLEVEYPAEREAGRSWDDSGDAVLVRFVDGTVEIETLPPYSEVTP